jgi:hypothetical protein
MTETVMEQTKACECRYPKITREHTKLCMTCQQTIGSMVDKDGFYLVELVKEIPLAHYPIYPN